MRKNITYVLIAAGLLASCSDSTENVEMFLNGSSKTPIDVRTTIGTGLSSRAYDKTFEKGDELFAYIEAGYKEGDNFISEGKFIWKGVFTLGKMVMTTTPEGVGNITSTEYTTDLSPAIYWDDFSSVDYDLRATGVNRGIRLKYGYCYNGGTANASNNTSDEAIANGTLTWTVLSDQSAEDGSGMKHSDLLYAATQPMVKYTHDSGTRGELVLPYTHAMSKVTINVTAGEGFTDKDNFASSVLTLKNMQTKASVDVPADTVAAVSTAGTADITTFNKSKANKTATYQAIIAPTNLSAGNLLAHIEGIDGNNYDIPITQGILDAWSAENRLIISDEEIQDGMAQAKTMSRAGISGGTGYTTKQGIHYILDVTVNKQKITLRATITDWDAVSATGVSQINFSGDVTEKGAIASELQANGFDVYKSNDASSFPLKSTTTLTYSDGNWNYEPIIYWAGQSDNSFFRAVSPAGASSSNLTQGIDLMWGTSGNTGIAPRTGDVPLDFKHIMTKLSVVLKTTTDASKVNLEGATVKITNMANKGTYNIVDGTVVAGTPVDTMLEGKESGFVDYVIPQNISDDAKLIVTLADGTTYSLLLKDCEVESTVDGVSNTTWLTGKSYTYTIHLEKEKITFRAVVKGWDEATGSGNATLEWD